MAYEFQVVVDATDPHTQADWWALTLGWTVEPSNEEFIRRMIAEGHGGSIAASSEVGKGSTFRLNLPAHAEPD